MSPSETLTRLYDLFVNPDGTLRRPVRSKGDGFMSAEEMEARGLWERLVEATPTHFGEDGRRTVQKLLSMFDEVYEEIPAAGHPPEEERRFVDEFEDAISELQTILRMRDLGIVPQTTFLEAADGLRAAVSTISSRLLNDEPVQPHEWYAYKSSVAALNVRLKDVGLPHFSKISGDLIGAGNEALYAFGVATGAIPIEEDPERFRTDVYRAVDKAAELYVEKTGGTGADTPDQPASPWSPENTEENLLLSVDPGTASPEEIAELLADLSRIYRKVGGSGITFRFEDVTVKEEELA